MNKDNKRESGNRRASAKGVLNFFGGEGGGVPPRKRTGELFFHFLSYAKD